ncbi:MAG: exosortase/archaeosortase family protein [Verrucomicrobia bacterium]|nr:exosortase/archaeosortase family protein [Verrucomicrobiota bacterium]
MTNTQSNSKPGAPQEFLRELAACWRALPDKVLFFTMLAAWVALFHFLGNSALGHTKTRSLFGWLEYVYSSSADDEHGRLVPFVVLWLFWWKRKELLAVEKSSWWPALGLVGLGLASLVLATAIHQTQIAAVGFFAGLYGLTGLVWGRRWLGASFFPFFVFGFCVPLAGVLEPVTSPLRILATWLTVGVARVAGVDVIREGSQIYDAGRTYLYDVAPACSGIRSIVSLVAVTTIYGFVQLRSPGRRAAMIASALPLALLGNVARLTTVILTAELFGQEAGAWIEQKLGTVTFVAAVGGVFLLGRWLQKKENATT